MTSQMIVRKRLAVNVMSQVCNAAENVRLLTRGEHLPGHYERLQMIYDDLIDIKEDLREMMKEAREHDRGTSGVPVGTGRDQR